MATKLLQLAALMASRDLFASDAEECWRCGNAGRSYDWSFMAERVPASLLAALADVMNWLDASHIPSMVVG